MKKIIKLLPAVILLILVSAFTVVSDGYKIGDSVADFKLKNIDGKLVSLSDYKEAKGYIVTFTCNTCPFAVAYEDRIIELDNKYAPKRLPCYCYYA